MRAFVPLFLRVNMQGVLSPVDESAPHTALEKATATIASIYPVVFPTAGVRTHFTKKSRVQDLAMSGAFTWESIGNNYLLFQVIIAYSQSNH